MSVVALNSLLFLFPQHFELLLVIQQLQRLQVSHVIELCVFFNALLFVLASDITAVIMHLCSQHRYW